MLGIKDLRTDIIVEQIDGDTVWVTMIEGNLVIAKMGNVGSTIVPRGVDYEIVVL